MPAPPMSVSTMKPIRVRRRSQPRWRTAWRTRRPRARAVEDGPGGTLRCLERAVRSGRS